MTAPLSPAFNETGFANSIFPTEPRKIPLMSLEEMSSTFTENVIEARPSVTLLWTSGSLNLTASTFSIRTSFQIPISRPLTVGIQSQPTVAWNVGLSAPS